MANIISYSNLFGRLKLLIKYFNVLETLQTDTGADNLPFIKNTILAPYESQDLTEELLTLEADFSASIANVGTLKLAIIGYFEIALRSIAQELGVHSTALADILLVLSDAMTHDSQTLKARELIIHASDVDTDLTIKPHTSNTGNGSLLYTLTTLLGTSEIANAEVLQCRCLSSTTLKQESFQLSGEPNHGRESHLGQGSGLGPMLTSLGLSIDNGSFEDWTASPIADEWTATVGAWGLEISQESSVIYEGASAVKTAYAQGDWKITTPMPITLLPDTMYVMSLMARKVASATGTLRFGISTGSAKDAFKSGCFSSVSIATLTTSYTLQFIAFKTPMAVDATWTLGISVDTPAVADIYFDLVQFGAMSLFNNIYFAICSGSTGFGIDDKFGFGSDNAGFEVAESVNGIIQKFIGRCFDTQLPSTTGAETISDP